MFKKQAVALFLIVFLLALPAQAKPLAPISKLQKQRVQACREIQRNDIKRLIKNVKTTENFLKDEVDDDPRFKRMLQPAYDKIARVYQMQAIDRVSDVLIYQIYRDGLMFLREKYREPIRLERVRVNGPDIDQFENDCAELV